MKINDLDIDKRFIDAINFICNKSSEEGITIKYSDIGAKLGYSRQSISEMMNGRMKVNPYTIRNFCLLYNVSFDWIMLGSGDIKDSRDRQHEIVALGNGTLDINRNQKYQIPIYNSASAGYIVGYSQEDQQLYLEYHQMSVHKEQLTRGFTVYGDSMMFALADKDIVFCRRVVDVKSHLFKQDSIYVLICSDGVTVKHLKRKEAEGGFELIPENTRYRTYFLANEEILEIWKAEAKLSNLF